jgi:hypothetical protein
MNEILVSVKKCVYLKNAKTSGDKHREASIHVLAVLTFTHKSTKSQIMCASIPKIEFEPGVIPIN